MSRRIVRQLLTQIDTLETELAHVKHERDQLIERLFWTEGTCKTQQHVS